MGKIFEINCQGNCFSVEETGIAGDGQVSIVSSGFYKKSLNIDASRISSIDHSPITDESSMIEIDVNEDCGTATHNFVVQTSRVDEVISFLSNKSLYTDR